MPGLCWLDLSGGLEFAQPWQGSMRWQVEYVGGVSKVFRGTCWRLEMLQITGRSKLIGVFTRVVGGEE